MSVATPERPTPFEPGADYAQTLAAYGQAFAANQGEAVDLGGGRRLLVGDAEALTSHDAHEDAVCVRSYIVHTALEGGGDRYEHETYDIGDSGERMGTVPRIDDLSTRATSQELQDYTEYTGQVLRDILEGTKFDSLEAGFAADSYNKTGRTAEQLHDAVAREEAALEHARQTPGYLAHKKRAEWLEHEAYTDRFAAEQTAARRAARKTRIASWVGKLKFW